MKLKETNYMSDGVEIIVILTKFQGKIIQKFTQLKKLQITLKFNFQRIGLNEPQSQMVWRHQISAKFGQLLKIINFPIQYSKWSFILQDFYS
jgi:hypothetical protein